MLNACATLGALEEGRDIHEQIVQNGCESDIFVGSSLFDMYAKCRVVEDAQRVFKQMKTRNVVSWNAMILGHVKHGHGQRALELSQQMHHEGVEALLTCMPIVVCYRGCTQSVQQDSHT
jgi:pentatricopeptide repeat protein